MYSHVQWISFEKFEIVFFKYNTRLKLYRITYSTGKKIIIFVKPLVGIWLKSRKHPHYIRHTIIRYNLRAL